jgi:hypothetical protein
MNHVILFGVSFKGNAVELIRSSVFWVGYNNAWNQNENDGAHTIVLSAGGVGWGFKGAGQQLLPDY